MNVTELQQYFNLCTHKKNYQDIECLNIVGDSKSYLTWEKIQSLVCWSGKTIVDMGCYHGYFSFKAEQMGVKSVLGLDHNKILLDMANKIKSVLNSGCEFKYWTNTDVIPNSDILLCLNILHYFNNQEDILQQITTQEVIFEIDKELLPLIQRYLKIKKCFDSHRNSWHTTYPNRFILLAQKI